MFNTIKRMVGIKDKQLQLEVEQTNLLDAILDELIKLNGFLQSKK